MIMDWIGLSYNEAVDLAGMVFLGCIALIIAGAIVRDVRYSTRRAKYRR
jgi:hypothetical protein